MKGSPFHLCNIWQISTLLLKLVIYFFDLKRWQQDGFLYSPNTGSRIVFYISKVHSLKLFSDNHLNIRQ